MSKKNETTREDARRILRNGILNMSVARLIQMSHYGLMGNILSSNDMISVENVFNLISYNGENNIITFSAEESQGSYGMVSFSLDAIIEISGCDDKDNPDEYLNVNIKLKNKTNICIKIMY